MDNLLHQERAGTFVTLKLCKPTTHFLRVATSQLLTRPPPQRRRHKNGIRKPCSPGATAMRIEPSFSKVSIWGEGSACNQAPASIRNTALNLAIFTPEEPSNKAFWIRFTPTSSHARCNIAAPGHALLQLRASQPDVAYTKKGMVNSPPWDPNKTVTRFATRQESCLTKCRHNVLRTTHSLRWA